MTAITKQDALQIIATALDEALDDVQPEANLKELEGWDSMGILLMIAEFDERFSLIIEEEKIASLKCVNDILNLLAENNLLSD